MFKKITLLCGAFACSMMVAHAPAIAAGNDTQDVEAAVENLRIAMVAADLKQLEVLTSSELSYGHSNGNVQTQAQFADDFKTGASHFLNIALTEQTVKVVGDTAVIRHRLEGDTKDAGKAPGHVSLKILMVWKKQHGHWLLLARQAVRIAS